jgi:hypothetical protein
MASRFFAVFSAQGSVTRSSFVFPLSLRPFQVEDELQTDFVSRKDAKDETESARAFSARI